MNEKSDNTYKVCMYDESKEKEWDSFLNQSAINGTFLQSRRFLNYHPISRFQDMSMMIYDKKNHLAALCPACEKYINGKRLLISHLGSTFGGIVFGKKYYEAHKVIEIIRCLEETWKLWGINIVDLRITPTIFSKKNSSVLEYAFYYLNYQEKTELSTYINYNDYDDEVLKNFAQGKRTNVNNCLKEKLIYRELNTCEEINDFYKILCENLQKFNTVPVHTFDELIKLHTERIPNECKFYGVFKDNLMLAGSMMFFFYETNVAHTQYLCAKQEYHTLSPMTFLYYAMICEMKAKGFSKISFGISTEDEGKTLNWGLTKSKESFGGEHTLNRRFYKIL